MNKSKNGLEIEEDIDYERRTWTVERVGWVLMFLFLVAAVLGFTGRGGLLVDKKKAGGSDLGFEAEYEPYVRNGASSKIKVTFYNPATEQKLRVSKTLINRARLEKVIPEPSNSEIDDNGITYTFSSTGRETMVILYFKPLEFGTLHNTISSEASTITLNQFVYP